MQLLDYKMDGIPRDAHGYGVLSHWDQGMTFNFSSYIQSKEKKLREELNFPQGCVLLKEKSNRFQGRRKLYSCWWYPYTNILHPNFNEILIFGK